MQIIAAVLINLCAEQFKDFIGGVGLVLAVAYQYSLSHLGLRDFIQQGSKGDGSRAGLLDANREGVVSCVGHFAVYLIAIHLGKDIFKPRSVVVKGKSL